MFRAIVPALALAAVFLSACGESGESVPAESPSSSPTATAIDMGEALFPVTGGTALDVGDGYI